MPRLTIASGPHQGEQIEVPKGTFTLGRAETNDFPFDDGSVSGRHCQITVTDFAVRIKDLGSTNGTFVNDRQVEEAELANGQTLTLGTLKFRLEVEPAHIAIPELPSVETLPPTSLPDGTAACYNHSDVAADLRCVQCHRTFCESCVKVLRLVGGKSRVFCPACSGSCQPIGPSAAKPKPKSFATRFWDTIRIPFRRPTDNQTEPRA